MQIASEPIKQPRQPHCIVKNLSLLKPQLSRSPKHHGRESGTLGSYITEGGRYIEEIKRRLCKAKNAFQKMRNILTNSHLSVKTRQRAVKNMYGQKPGR